MKHVVMFSGGIGSWVTAKRVAEKYGTSDLILVFADTLTEDPDLYRFIVEGAANVFGMDIKFDFSIPDLVSGTELDAQRGHRKVAIRDMQVEVTKRIPGLTWLIEGRDIWDVFQDVKFLGNSSVDPCSLVLKRRFLRAWIRASFVPAIQDMIQKRGVTLSSQDAIHEAVKIGIAVDNKVKNIIKKANRSKSPEKERLLAEAEQIKLPILEAERSVADELRFYIGYDWTETARWDKAKRYWEPFQVDCPLVDPPLLHKSEMLGELRKHGIAIPNLYLLNMPHNNCGAKCVKAGHAQWYRVLEVARDEYAIAEQLEQEWQHHCNSSNTILKDRRGGSTKPLSLMEFRQRWEEFPDAKKQSIQAAWVKNFGVLPEELTAELQSLGIDLDDTSGCGCFSGV